MTLQPLDPSTLQPSSRRAVIDIGTNSVKLLVADVSSGAVEPVWEGSEQTRLGCGFYDDHRLRPEAITNTAMAVAHFVQIAREQGAAHLRIIATSAARDAVNAGELLSAVRAAAGQAVEVISGEQEADWAFQGVLTDSSLRERPVLILDVGGGSTEFILGDAGHSSFRDSFKLGTVRLLESTRLSDPPTPAELVDIRKKLRDFLDREVRPQLAPHLQSIRREDLALVGTGGTTSILARLELQLPDYDRARIETAHFDASRLRWHVEHLWGLPLCERRKLAGMPPNRADVILFGVVIYEAVMGAFGIASLRVSTRGLRFAAVR
ncbi:MAG: Ppx/GppA family phosphatase [Verrucomicrobia bacterium]|nr:Ppx/GppA family phosphatase [Verrucomicrobiota bacterium]